MTEQLDTEAAIDSFVAAFEATDLPRSRWTHAAHLVVAFWTLEQMAFPAALAHLRDRIRAYNEAVGVANTASSGYHETLTAHFLQAVAAERAQYPDLAAAEALERLLRSPLANPDWPLQSYSPERLASPEARGRWLAPDLGPPILYSFRRCPYAIRARLAIEAAGLLVQLREVELKAKPAELLAASPKGTVPVLVLSDGTVLEESLDVMTWALAQHDPGDWRRHRSTARQADERSQIAQLIATNDQRFKPHLDGYKYGDRHPFTDPLQHRQAALTILREWSGLLESGGWLVGEQTSLADIAVLPFVRQFRLADPAWFDALEDIKPLQDWLGRFLASPELATAMAPQSPWRPGDPLRLYPPQGRIYHLALASDWHDALEQVGFIHTSFRHQLAATHARFYADGPDLVLLTIDPASLGASLRLEAVGGQQELFPHLYGPLPIEAVVGVEPWPC